MKQVYTARENYTTKCVHHDQMDPEYSIEILPFSSDLYKTSISNPLNSVQAFDSLSLVLSKMLPSTLLKKQMITDFPMGNWED